MPAALGHVCMWVRALPSVDSWAVCSPSRLKSRAQSYSPSFGHGHSLTARHKPRMGHEAKAKGQTETQQPALMENA